MSKIEKEFAVEEFERFATAFRLDPIKRKKLFDRTDGQPTIIDGITELIEEGMAIVDENNAIVYNLLEPTTDVKGDIHTAVCVFAPKRVSINAMQKIEEAKGDVEKMKQILSLLTGIAPAIIGKFSTADMEYVGKIATFFMSA